MKRILGNTILIFLLFQYAVHAGNNLVFGVNGIALGKPVSSPSIDDAFSGKAKGVTLNKFYHIGGYTAPIAQSDARLFYDENALYVIFKFDNPSPIKDLLPRDDKMALYINLKNDLTKYYQFSIDLKNITEGKYYFKGDSFKTLSIPKAETKISGDKWYGKLTMPWSAIGGKPSNTFGLMLMRHRQQNAPEQNAELSSPTALDFNNEQRPGLYMETTFGSSPSVGANDGKMLTKLPSGVLHWQRPSLLVMPSAEERSAIWKMQEDLKNPTTKDNFVARVQSTQRLLDQLILEGFSFATFGGLWNPLKGEYHPWEARAAINMALNTNNPNEAYRIMDVLLKKLDKASRSWYADESAGNIRTDQWTKLDKIIKLEHADNVIKISGTAGKMTLNFALAYSKIGAFRLKLDNGGYYDSENVPFTNVGSDKEGMMVSGNDEALAIIKQGENWSIAIKDSLSGADKWKLQKGDLSFRIKDGKIIAVDLAGSLALNESVYGFGERFDAVNQRDLVLTLWDLDAWEATFKGIFNHSYKIIPLIHSTKGSSVFLNTSYRIRADVGNQQKNKYRYTAQGPIFDVYIWNQMPIKVIESFSKLTGKPILPPKWVFEPWMGGGWDRWFYAPLKNPTQEMINVVDKFEKLDIPHSGIYAEGSGHEDPLLHAKLAPKNIRIFSWGSPWIIKEDRAIQLLGVSGKDLPFIRVQDGTIQNFPNPEYLEMNQRYPHIDFFHPKAMDLLRADWKRRFDLGVAGSMVDFADIITDEAVFYNGKKGDEMHNIYCLEYHKLYFQTFSERRGSDHVLYGRAAAPGSQKYLSQFGGDHQSNFHGLTAAIKGLISMGSVGFSNWGCDIGGYIGFADEEIYNRWLEWGVFNPIMRVHGTKPREPWEYSDATVKNYKKHAWFRENILDYTYSNAVNTYMSGIPIVRPLQVAYPEQKALKDVDDEYLFGPDLLIAPVHHEGESREIIFPEGNWVSLWTNKAVAGGSKQNVNVPLTEIPVYLREGALIPAELNSSLIWGESMTHNKLKVLVVTPPKKLSTAYCWADSITKATITSAPESIGFKIKIEDRPDTRFVIVYGATGKVAKVKINNEEAALLKGDLLTSLPVGWYEDKDGRIIVRLPYQSVQEIEISY
jgi:alpha-glucosidase (family GH31 glycosyl hydrolase)